MLIPILILILTMFVVFIIVCGACSMLLLLITGERKRTCGNCEDYDESVSCCGRSWVRVDRDSRGCETFKRRETWQEQR